MESRQRTAALCDKEKSRTDNENRSLCSIVASHFVDKITHVLSDTVKAKTCYLAKHVDLSGFPRSSPLFDSLSPVTADEVLKILYTSPPKSSTMDIIPTSLLVTCSSAFSEIILDLLMWNNYFWKANFHPRISKLL